MLALAVPSAKAQVDKIRVGLGYLPDVQFAPFYTAEKAGFYKQENLEVEFQHGFVSELYPLLAAGKIDFVVADAEDVLTLPFQQENPAFKYVMALYQKVPNVIFAKSEKEIRSINDLKGKTIGVPGLFGSSYTSLQAILKAAKLKESDIKINQIGFTQLESILTDRVDAAMGFINNEPLVLAEQKIKIDMIKAADYNPAPGNGVIASQNILKNADLTKRFLKASQKGIGLTIDDPKQAFIYAKSFVNNLDDSRLNVLTASIPLYQSSYTKKYGLGFSDPMAWSKTLALLKENGRVKTSLPSNAFYSNSFLMNIQPK